MTETLSWPKKIYWRVRVAPRPKSETVGWRPGKWQWRVSKRWERAGKTTVRSADGAWGSGAEVDAKLGIQKAVGSESESGLRTARLPEGGRGGFQRKLFSCQGSWRDPTVAGEGEPSGIPNDVLKRSYKRNWRRQGSGRAGDASISEREILVSEEVESLIVPEETWPLERTGCGVPTSKSRLVFPPHPPFLFPLQG